MQRLQPANQFAEGSARGEGREARHSARVSPGRGHLSPLGVGGVVPGGEALLVVSEAVEGEPPGQGRGGGRAGHGRRRVDEGVQGRPDYREVGAGRGAGVDPDCWFLRMLDG